ncbi:MAG: hypothetical protein ACON5H_12390 [Akkermansiaceae bacterium]
MPTKLLQLASLCFFGVLVSCGHPGEAPGAVGAIIPLENISPGIDNSDWSNAQSKAAWREHQRERTIEKFPF